MSSISTHILDTSSGQPAAGVYVRLSRMAGNGTWETAGEGTTNEDGRIPGLVAEGQTIKPGQYKLFFDTGGYFSRKNISAFYPFVEVVFEVKDVRHHHVPLLLNPFGYSTYRGS